MKKKTVVFIKGTRLYLRPLSIEDVPTIQRYANDPEVRHYVSNVYPLSLQEEKKWVEEAMKRDKEDILFVVCLKKSDKLLGLMGLHGINYVDGTASTGTLFGAKEEWNKGYAQEAKMLLLEYAFLTLNLRKVCSAAFLENKGSIQHNKNCGYVVEGILKKHWYRDGTYHNKVLLSVFKKDWMKIKKQNEL